MSKEKPKGWDDKKMAQSFPITAVTRFDVYGEMKDERAITLTDDEMAYIAEKLGEAYIDGGEGFWPDLRQAFDYIIKGRGK